MGRLRSLASRPPLALLLSLLVLATGVPLIAFTSAEIYGNFGRDEHDARRLMAGLAGISAANTYAVLEEYGRVAATLSRRPLVRELDAARCDSLMAGVRIMRPALTEIATLDHAGQVLCSVARRSPMVSALGAPRPDVPEPARPLAIGAPQKDGNGQWVVNIDYRVPGEGRADGVLRLALKLDALLPTVASGLSDGGVASLADGWGNVLARSPGAGFVGQQAFDAQRLQRFAAQREGFFVGAEPDQVERLYAFHAVGDSGWLAFVGMPTESVYADARRAALLSAIGVLAVLAMSLTFVVVLARRIAAPMAELTRTAQHAALGHFDRRASEEGPREVSAVAAGFNRLLERIPEMERAIRESEARHRSLVERAPHGIAVKQGGHVIYANPGLCTMLGLGDERLLLHGRLADWVEPPDREPWQARMAQLQVEPGTTPPFEFRMRRADGGVIEVEETSSSVRTQGGIVIQSHLHDMTAFNQARRALEVANGTLEAGIRERTQELQQANEALRSFSYSVAHDLRAPVTSVNGFAKLLQNEVRAGQLEKALSHAARIAASAVTMGRMIDGLLQLARAGVGPLERQAVDMHALVAQLTAELDEQARRAISLGPLPTVAAHEHIVRQVWSNLISNALKYSSRREHPQVRIACREQGGEFVFSVADNGVGFDPARAGELFSVFGRLSGAEDFEGTGVGLAIVKRIVERHGGRAWAEGRPGEGAAFFFTLPA